MASPLSPGDLDEVLARIGAALDRAEEVLREFTAGETAARWKSAGDPVTEADLRVDRVLRETLPRPGEGWLSEETADTRDRLERERTWIVDPLDGTREFVQGVPEWGVAVGLVVSGVPAAGGILNPATGQRLVGAPGRGVLLAEPPGVPPAGTPLPPEGSGGRALPVPPAPGPPGPREEPRPVAASGRDRLEGALVLASRSEVKRGEWDRFAGAPFRVRACGSVAWKLALVAAGRADATWTLVPKNEWDVAAGAALVLAGGGVVRALPWEPPRFNRETTLLPGFVACGARLAEPVRRLLDL